MNLFAEPNIEIIRQVWTIFVQDVVWGALAF